MIVDRVPFDTEQQRGWLRDRVAEHIGAFKVAADGAMICPCCGSAQFGPTMTLRDIARITLDSLSPLVVGVCVDCEYATAPARSYLECMATRARIGLPPRIAAPVLARPPLRAA